MLAWYREGMEGAAYRDPAIDQVDRLLSLMDRNRDAPTYGCLCRPYWHDKVMDFPSAHQQIGVLPLAIVYGEEFEGNPYHGDEEVGELCRAGIRYWTRIQADDGSFDEHYPREHSLGAVAWTLWAVTAATDHLDDPPDISGTVRRAVRFLEEHDEPGTLANHQAVAASALAGAAEHVDVPQELIRDRLDAVSGLQSSEGWFQEYRGPDMGYQSTTISHLARVRERCPGLVDDTVLEDALSFFGAFIDDAGYYGAGLGSRDTQHVHPTGFELLAQDFDEAARIASCVRSHLADGRMLEPSVMDDKHFSRLQSEYLEAMLASGPLDTDGSGGTRDYRYEDILVRSEGDERTFVNCSKGGQYRRYEAGDLVEEVRGVTARIGGTAYTADWMGTTEEVAIEDDRVQLSGRLREIPDNRLRWPRYCLLRLFQHSLGRFPSVSLWLKDRMIDRIITGGLSDHRFEREIDLEEGSVDDVCDGERIRGRTRSKFVPSSEFVMPCPYRSRGGDR